MQVAHMEKNLEICKKDRSGELRSKFLSCEPSVSRSVSLPNRLCGVHFGRLSELMREPS